MLSESKYGQKEIKTIGMCPGSGGSFLSGSKADLWWTGELSHHEILATVAGGTHVVLCKWDACRSRIVLRADSPLSDCVAGTHTATERPYLKSYFRAKLEETLNEVREEEKLDSEGKYEVVMSEGHEVEVVQFV